VEEAEEEEEERVREKRDPLGHDTSRSRRKEMTHVRQISRSSRTGQRRFPTHLRGVEGTTKRPRASEREEVSDGDKGRESASGRWPERQHRILSSRIDQRLATLDTLDTLATLATLALRFNVRSAIPQLPLPRSDRPRQYSRLSGRQGRTTKSRELPSSGSRSPMHRRFRPGRPQPIRARAPNKGSRKPD
jgi:hypothetical protein